MNFFIKEEEKSILKFNCELSSLETSGMISRDWIIVRLHQNCKRVLVVINRTICCEVYFNMKYKGKLQKCENFFLGQFLKILDALWMGDFIVALTNDFRIIAVNDKNETVFFLEEALKSSNFINLSQSLPKKAAESHCFLLKNEREDTLVIYLDKTVHIFDIETLEKKRDNYLDFLEECLFDQRYASIIRPLISKTIKKLEKNDFAYLNIYKIFSNFKKIRGMIQNQNYEYCLKKLKYLTWERIIEHLGILVDFSSYKYLGGKLEVCKYYPFSLGEGKKGKMLREFVTKGELSFAISLSFLLFPGFDHSLSQPFPKAILSESLYPLEKSGSSLTKPEISLTKPVLKLLIQGKILSVLAFFQEKSKVSNRKSFDYGISISLLLIFLKERLLSQAKTIKFLSSLFLNDLFAHFSGEVSKVGFQGIESFLKRTSFEKVSVEENQGNKINFLNLFIYLVDFLNIHEVYLPFLNSYFTLHRVQTHRRLNLLLLIFKILIEHRPLSQFSTAFFPEIIDLEKKLESELKGNIEKETSATLTAILISKKNQKFSELLVVEFVKKLKIALRFQKKHRIEGIFDPGLWKNSLWGTFIDQKFEKPNKQSEVSGNFPAYFRKILENTLILMGACLRDFFEREPYLFYDKLSKNKGKRQTDHEDSLKIQGQNQVFEKNFNKILSILYYIFLKMRFLSTDKNTEKLLLALKILRRFHKLEGKPSNFVAVIESSLKEFLNSSILTDGSSNKDLIGFYAEEMPETFAKIESFHAFKTKFLGNVNLREGEQWDHENFRAFADIFNDFLCQNYEKSPELALIKTRISYQDEVLGQLYGKYSRVFLYFPGRENRLDLFKIKELGNFECF